MSKTLDLTADIDTPIEGAWTADRNSPTLPLTMTLYSSPYFPSQRPGQRGVAQSGQAQIGTVSVRGLRVERGRAVLRSNSSQ